MNSLNVCEIDTANEFEKVFHFTHKHPSVEGIVAIHNTLKGPALGGLRLYDYANFQHGMKDVLQLARAMTFKNAIMDLPYGGGKSVIFQNNHCNRDDTLNVFSLMLNHLDGKYLTADDVGTSVKDMYFLRKSTPFARGFYYNEKQIPATSYGVYQAIKATLKYYSNLNNLSGVKIVVQGLGKVGYNLCRYLHQEDCILYVIDKIDQLVEKAVREFNAIPIDLDTTKKLDVDVFSPCALSGTITNSLISKMQVKYIIGGENNPLATQGMEKILLTKGITYIPDYLSSAGGVIDIACEGDNYSEEFVLAQVAKIYDKTIDILTSAKLTNTTPLEVSNNYVQNQLNKIGKKRH